MQYINNGDSASSIRTKLNELIDAYNATTTTTSTTMYMPPAGDTTTTTTMMAGGPGGDSNTLNIKDNGMFSAEGNMNSSDACAAAVAGNSYTFYFQKQAPNTGSDLENGDRVYTDEAFMMTPPTDKWYVYYDAMMMMNKFFYVNMTGYVEQLNFCA